MIVKFDYKNLFFLSWFNEMEMIDHWPILCANNNFDEITELKKKKTNEKKNGHLPATIDSVMFCSLAIWAHWVSHCCLNNFIWFIFTKDKNKLTKSKIMNITEDEKKNTNERTNGRTTMC